MTTEEAIKILDPETSRGTLWKYEDKEERLEAVNEACRLAVAALRAQQKLNVPLTLEELRGMDGEPVWVDFPKCPEASGWMLISAGRHCVYDGLLGDCDFENCGNTWLAYRRRPEEGTT